MLLWGAESMVNFYTQRPSPSRFIYQYPLYEHGYVDDKMIKEFLQDLIINPPQLIVDTRNPITPIFELPDLNKDDSRTMEEIKSNYEAVDTINSWTIYQYIDQSP